MWFFVSTTILRLQVLRSYNSRINWVIEKLLLAFRCYSCFIWIHRKLKSIFGLHTNYDSCFDKWIRHITYMCIGNLRALTIKSFIILCFKKPLNSIRKIVHLNKHELQQRCWGVPIFDSILEKIFFSFLIKKHFSFCRAREQTNIK